ncbi:MAG: D-aminoacylase [Betaproteobacteria bacterium]|nr:D-aminoacylase [Betaproteobacteria bacterium]
MYDLIVAGGTVVDGTGAPAVRADVAIEDGRIAEVGDLGHASAVHRIDAAGKAVAPGFIDTHAHSEISVIAQPDAPAKIRQGVTTEVVGNCGFSAFPLAEETREMARHFARPVLGHPEIDWEWSDAAGYFSRLERQGVAVNVATLIGHGTLRNAVLGFDKRAPAAGELRTMQALLQQGMEQGAFGISTGLCYPPGVFAGTDEIVELCRVVARNGGVYATHLRDQSDRLEQSVAEALEIGRRARVPVLISHHKAAGRRNWGKVKATLAMLDQARAAGHETWSDVYPYIAGQSTIISLLPSWVIDGGLEAMLARLNDPAARERIAREFETGLPGWENRAGAVGWDNVIVTSVVTDKNRDIEGLSVHAAAQRHGKGDVEFLLELIMEERGTVGKLSIQCCEEDVLTVLTHSRTMIGSDGLDVGNPHPRQYGCFARVLGEYVREKNALSLEAAIHKMTGLPARVFGFAELGLVKPGLRADLVVFDPATVRETGTFKDPRRHPEGIEWVLVGGVAAMAEGRPTGERNGSVLRKGTAGS